MLTLVATGYTSGTIKREDSEYGKNGTISIRCKTSNGKHVCYVNATFYGKQIDVIEKFVGDGRQITIIGRVNKIIEKEKKDGTKYSAVYMYGDSFTIPENNGPGEDRYSKGGKSRSQEQGGFQEEDEVPF